MSLHLFFGSILPNLNDLHFLSISSHILFKFFNDLDRTAIDNFFLSFSGRAFSKENTFGAVSLNNINLRNWIDFTVLYGRFGFFYLFLEHGSPPSLNNFDFESEVVLNYG